MGTWLRGSRRNTWTQTTGRAGRIRNEVRVRSVVENDDGVRLTGSCGRWTNQDRICVEDEEVRYPRRQLEVHDRVEVRERVLGPEPMDHSLWRFGCRLGREERDAVAGLTDVLRAVREEQGW